VEKSVSELTAEYIKGHPAVKSCLKKGLINYSSLARLVAKELGAEKASKEAILVAARRFKERLSLDFEGERQIASLLSRSELEIKSKISLFILEKGINLDRVDEIQKKVRKESGTFFLLEGSDNYTIVTQEKFAPLVKSAFLQKTIKSESGLVLINIKSPKEIQALPGVVAYLSSLFFENGVNILEFISCWTDTLFVIESKDLNNALNFLKF